MSLEETQAFFEGYRDAFNRLDGDAVADRWCEQSGITDSEDEGAARLTWWPSSEPMRANHRALCELYRKAGYGSARFAIEQHVPLGPQHAFTHVHWTIQDKSGKVMQSFHTGYQLMRSASGPKVLLAVAHEERW